MGDLSFDVNSVPTLTATPSSGYCNKDNGKLVCFNPARIQHMKEDYMDPINTNFSRFTTSITFRVANIYGNSSLATVREFNATEAVQRLSNNAIIQACQASEECRTRWNIEAVAERSPGSSGGFPWWLILLIILVCLVCCLCCVVLLCMRYKDEHMEETNSVLVRETSGRVTKTKNDRESLPKYAHKTGSLTDTASDVLEAEEADSMQLLSPETNDN